MPGMVTRRRPLTEKDIALKALAKRRVRNAKLKVIDNSRLPAGSPMYFNCKGCRAQIVVPESYISRPQHCDDCQALIDKGWLE